ncbi:hypothetical protein OAF45_02105 [Candidatus Latescibacteria bacterium]|nr:hypothetical protein [Candidatus Latescibacterota bacterium]
MKKRVEDYLGDLSHVEFEPSTHQHELRRELIQAMASQIQASGQRNHRLLVYALVAVASLATLVGAGMGVREYFFKGGKKGVYLFETRPQTTDAGEIIESKAVVKVDPSIAIDADQIERELSDIDLLSQQERRILVKIFEIEVDGVSSRTNIYRYQLSDAGEKGFDEKGLAAYVYDTFSNKEELRDSIKEIIYTKKGVLLSSREKEVNDQRFIFERYKYTLEDGREMIFSIGVPKEQDGVEEMPSKQKYKEKKDIKDKYSKQEHEGFTLHANVPNPFNSRTTIRYEIPEASDVQITVYNLKKQKVRILLDRRMEAGSHQVMWDGRDEVGQQVASGTYWVHMEAAPFQGTLKVTFAK